MGTKINVGHEGLQVRLTIEEPTGTDEPNAVISRHWDVPVTHALMLAAGITGEVIQLIQSQIKANTQPPPSANGLPVSQEIPKDLHSKKRQPTSGKRVGNGR